MLDLIIRNANLPDGKKGIDIAIENGSIVQVGPNLDAQATREIREIRATGVSVAADGVAAEAAAVYFAYNHAKHNSQGFLQGS